MGELRERAFSFGAEQLVGDAAATLVDLVESEMFTVVLGVAEQTYPGGFAGWCADHEGLDARRHLFETRRRVTWQLAQLFLAEHVWLCEVIDGS